MATKKDTFAQDTASLDEALLDGQDAGQERDELEDELFGEAELDDASYGRDEEEFDDDFSDEDFVGDEEEEL